jgi:hypothetical protein
MKREADDYDRPRDAYLAWFWALAWAAARGDRAEGRLAVVGLASAARHFDAA